MLLVLGMTSAFALDVASGKGGNATITVSNAAKGETYKVIKIFGATVTGTTDGPISYTGDILEGLGGIFQKDATTGAITVKAAAVDSNGDFTQDSVDTITEWANATGRTVEAQGVADGTALVFTGLQYGYYVVTTTQGSVVTVDDTNPNATIIDKNTTTPELHKNVDDDDVFIGQTVTYTVDFLTANYDPNDGKQIKEYYITDTLPSFLTNVTVTNIKIGNAKGDGSIVADYKVSDEVPQFTGDPKKITIPWATEDAGSNPKTYTSLYKNGAVVTITYTAEVTDQAAIAGAGNTNTVKLGWKAVDDTNKPDQLQDSETIYTYALALKKVNESGTPLGGATFQLPFAVTGGTNGIYTYAGSGASTVTTDTANSAVIVIKGIQSTEDDLLETNKGTYTIIETVAPDGYNKLSADVDVTVIKTSETTTSITKYLDAQGNITSETENTTAITYTNDVMAVSAFEVVVNKQGAELPSTGGIGTTIFYIGGSILVLAAVILLVTKRRMGTND